MARRSTRRSVDPAPPAQILEEGPLLDWLQGTVLVAVGTWIYFSVFNGDWLWDDDKVLTRNPLIHDPHGFWNVWIRPDGLGNYDPLTSAVRWLQWQAWGDNPLGYHLLSLGLHLGSAFLIWRLFSRLDITQAWLGAMLFAVHPLMVESVAWVAELKNTLSLPPLLLVFLAYLTYLEKGRRPVDYLWALGWFIVSMLAKTAGMMLPVVLLGYLYYRQRLIGWREVRSCAPFFLVALLAGLVTVWPQHETGPADVVVATGGWNARVAAMGWTILFLTGKVFWPVGLVPVYPTLALEMTTLAAAVPWLLIAGAFLLFWRKRQTWGMACLAGFGFFIVNLVPVLGYIAMKYETMVWSLDHLVYLPIIGLIGLVTTGVGALRLRWGESGRPWIMGGATMVLTLLAFLAHGYAIAFSDEETLWRYTVGRYPGIVLAQENLGKALLQSNRPEEAVAPFATGVKLDPQHADTHFNLGRALVESGRLEEGIAEYRAALEIRPQDAEVENNLGVALVQAGKLEEAIQTFTTVTQYKPDYELAYANLGGALAQIGRNQEAVQVLTRALELKPGAIEVRNNLGIVLEKLGRIPEAREQFQEVLREEPGNRVAQEHLNKLPELP